MTGADDHTAEAAKTGAMLLLEQATAFVERALAGDVAGRCPSVATRKQRFSPVLVGEMLKRDPDAWQRVVQVDSGLASADALAKVLRAIEQGLISDARDLRTALVSHICKPLNVNFQAAMFDLLYAALQSSILAQGASAGVEADDQFRLVASLVYSLASMGRRKQSDAPLHVEHFLAHAAVFLSARTVHDHWRDAVSRASVLMEAWGAPVPPPAVFTHSAHNLWIRCRGLAESDLQYDLIKHLRARVKQGELRRDDACEALVLAFGWQDAYRVLRLLWNELVQEFERREAGLVAAVAREAGPGEAAARATKRGYSSPLGLPYVRTDSPLTGRGEFVVSFPGGWDIGKTCVLCKTGAVRLLLDFGSDESGRSPVATPDMALVDAVLISHAHQDHIGGLLDLYSQREYDGPWFGVRDIATPADLMLRDSVKLHKLAFGPDALYDDDDVDRVMSHFVGIDVGSAVRLGGDVHARPVPAGHVAGSCQWLIGNGGKFLLYSGDFNTRPSLSVQPFEYPTENEIENTVGVIVEGTYAGKEDEALLGSEAARDVLIAEIQDATSRPVLVPVLSLGRAQEVCRSLAGTKFRVGVFGLAARMTSAILRDLPSNIVFDQRRLEAVREEDYDVLVASSGCLQGGPSRVFWERWPLITTILTGYLFPGTPARRIAESAPRVRFSAHAPRDEWQTYVDRFSNAKKFVIHLPGWPLANLAPGVTVPRSYEEYRIA